MNKISVIHAFSHKKGAKMKDFLVWSIKFVAKMIKIYYNILHEMDGEVSEWSNVHAWKACIGKPIGGSNPLLSATKTHTKGALKLYRVCLFLCLLFVLRDFYTPFSF